LRRALRALLPVGASLQPRIEQAGFRTFKVRDVARYQRHAMHQRRGHDQTVATGARIWNVQDGAAPGDHCIDGQDTVTETRQDMVVELRAQ
jgi:hypothetical protein